MALKYTKDHEWIKVENGIASVGITEHAANALGTLVFVELPEIGLNLNIGDSCGVVESAKSASDVYSPIAGEVIDVNTALSKNPEEINDAKDGDVWICKIEIYNLNDLNEYMSKEEYDTFLQS